MLRLRSNDLAWQELDGNVVILDLKAGVYLEINNSGSALFPMLVSGADLEALEGELVRRYGLTDEAATADVDAFVSLLRQRRLLDE